MHQIIINKRVVDYGRTMSQARWKRKFVAPTGYAPKGRYTHTLSQVYGRNGPVTKRTRGYYRGEVKFVDSELNAAAITQSWQTLNPTTLDTLSAIAQGTTESTHNGRTCYIRSIHLKGQISVGALESETAPPSDRIARVCLVLSEDTKGTEVVAADVMDTGQSNDVFAFRNLQNTSVIKVLKDLTMTIRNGTMNEGAVNLFAQGTMRRHFKMNYRFKKPLRVLFSGTTAVVGSIVDNSLHIVACNLVTGPTMQLDYQCRVRFSENENI